MTSPTPDIEVYVYAAKDCEAARQTIAKFRELGIEPQRAPIEDARWLMKGWNHRISPLVAVWRCHGHQRRAIVHWDGHRPGLIYLARACIEEVQKPNGGTAR